VKDVDSHKQLTRNNGSSVQMNQAPVERRESASRHDTPSDKLHQLDYKQVPRLSSLHVTDTTIEYRMTYTIR